MDERWRRAADHWGQSPPDIGRTFYTFQPVRGYFLSNLAGGPVRWDLPRDWYERWVCETYLRRRPPAPDCLSLCCGWGEIERILAGLGAFDRCLGVDVSAGAVAGAARAAAAAGLNRIEYRQADLNNLELPPESYDLIWSNGALHHIDNLEGLMPRLHAALRPGGLLLGNEYAGPRHFGVDGRVQEVVNAMVHLFPERFRGDRAATFAPPWLRRRPGGLVVYRLRRRLGAALGRALARGLGEPPALEFGKLWEADPVRVARQDPSEAVASDTIVQLLRRHFEWLDLRPMNGGALMFALDRRFMEAYDDTRPEDRRLLENLFQLERTLTELGEIPPMNFHFAAGKAPVAGRGTV